MFKNFSFKSIDFKDKKTQNYLVIGMASVLAVLTLSVMYNSLFGDTNPETTRNDKEMMIGGEANRLNLTVPVSDNSLNADKGEQYARYIQDSLQGVRQANEFESTTQTASYNVTPSPTTIISDQEFEQMRQNARKGSTHPRHNPYGTESMWQTQQPNNTIGYTDMGGTIPRPTSRSNQLPQPTESSEKSGSVNQAATMPTLDTEGSIPTGHRLQSKLITKGKIVNGSRLAFVLLQSFNSGEVHIRKNQVVFGTAKITPNRLLVALSNIKAGSKTIPLNMRLLGDDGLEGLIISGTSTTSTEDQINREVKSAAGQIVGNIVGSIPIVGGALNGITRSGVKSDAASITIVDHVSATIIIYK